MVSNDAARNRLNDVMTGLQSQLADIAVAQQKQAALRVNAQAADGAVEATVNARGQLVDIVIDQSYLDDHDFDELRAHIVEAAQTAARDAGQRVAKMLAPINKRHKSMPTFSDMVEGIPDPSDFMPPRLDSSIPAPPRTGSSGASAGGVYDDGDGGAQFPRVRR
jgi:DNA-binding protein YbaB